jgi:hypothetical protein
VDRREQLPIHGFNIGLFALILVICIVGFKIGKYIAHFGTFTMILVNALLVGLLFVHPHATRGAPASLAAGAVFARARTCR